MSTNKNSWTDLLNNPTQISSEDMPEIELYMDQVTTFMDTRLGSSKRYPEDKILTKTMINNYTKNHLLPPSVKKKYSKEHLMMLIFIYHLKSMLSITDIQTMLEPISESFFSNDEGDGLTLKDIYDNLSKMCYERHPEIIEDICHSHDISGEFCPDSDQPQENDYLNTFFFIFQLCYDIYVRKQLVERLIDRYRDSHPAEKGKDKMKKKKKQ